MAKIYCYLTVDRQLVTLIYFLIRKMIKKTRNLLYFLELIIWLKFDQSNLVPLFMKLLGPFKVGIHRLIHSSCG